MNVLYPVSCMQPFPVYILRQSSCFKPCIAWYGILLQARAFGRLLRTDLGRRSHDFLKRQQFTLAVVECCDAAPNGVIFCFCLRRNRKYNTKAFCYLMCPRLNIVSTPCSPGTARQLRL